MKKKYIALILIVIGVSGLFILNLYNNLEQQRQEKERLAERMSLKTLTLSPNTIQIISIDNQNSPLSNVCSKPNMYSNWWVSGFVDFSQISTDELSVMS